MLAKTELNVTDFSSDEMVLRIQRARLKIMNDTAVSNFQSIGLKYADMPIGAKRQICKWIDSLPQNPMRFFVKKRILEWIGISKSQYYAILSNENYGIGAVKKANQDEKDIEVHSQGIIYM